MVRKVFTLIAAVSVLLNLVMDIRQYRHLQAAHAINDWVNQSREILNTIDKMIISAVEGPVDGDWPSLTEQIPYLSSVIDPKDKALNKGLDELEGLLDQPLAPSQQNMQAVKILNAMRTREENLLSERTERERQEKQIADNWIMQANLLDIFLISLMIFFFWYERITTKRTQAYLTQSLERLNSVNEVLLQTASKRQSLLQTTVHDLKNPLGSIRGFAELIRNEADSPKSVSEMSQVIQRISNDTLSLVSSLLTEQASTTQPAPESLSLVNLNQLLGEVCLYMGPIADLKKQKIELKTFSGDCLIRGDGKRLQDAFYNLISNGLKFSPPSSIVTVFCEKRANQIEIRVSDHGPGFQPDDLKNLFQPGRILSAKPTGHESSTGIGLYSAKQSIEMSDGHIEALNNPDGGACFVVKFEVQHEKTVESSPG